MTGLCYWTGVRHHGYLSEVFVSIQGEGLCAGRRQLFVRLSGCDLRCRYCDTPASLERQLRFQVHLDGRIDTATNPITASALRTCAQPLLEAGFVDGMAITGGEPLLQVDFLSDLLSDAHWPRPRLLETSGTHPEKLRAVLPVLDIVSMDIKLPSNSGESAFWDQHREFLALAAGKASVKVLIDETTAIEEVGRAANLVNATAPQAPLFIQPITAPSGRVSISRAKLDQCFTAARVAHSDVRVIPQLHKMLSIQ
jgi:7-carboxy-7-deazaguanine synthase